MLRPFISAMKSTDGSTIWDAAKCASLSQDALMAPLMRAAFFMNYLRRTYDNKLPLIFSELNDFITYTVQNLTGDDRRIPVLKSLVEDRVFTQDQLKLFGMMVPNAFSIPMDGSLSSYSAVTDTAKTFYAPYAQYLASLSKGDPTQMEESDAFSVKGLVSIPNFRIMGTVLVVDYSVTLPGYSFDLASIRRGANALPGYEKSFLGYLEGYDFSGKDSMSILGLLAGMSQEKDLRVIDAGSLSYLYYRLAERLLCCNTTVRKTPWYLVKDTGYIREVTLNFLKQLNDRYKITISDGTVLVDTLGTNPPSEKDKMLSSYFAANSTDKVTMESHRLFLTSSYRVLPQLDIQNRTMADEGTATPPNPKDPGDAPVGDPPTEQPSPSPDEKTPAPDAPSEPAQDPKVDPATPPEEPPPPSSDPATPPPAPSTSEPSGTLQAHTTQNTEVTNGSDKSGIVIELAGKETLDSYLLREEISTKLTAFLANPPKDISIEKLTMLRRLKAYWLHLMSVRTVCDIISAATNLTLKQKSLV
jgi:hypothetical protein